MAEFAIVLGVHEKLSAWSEVGEGEGPLGKRSRRWEGNINIYACPDGKECGIFDWSKLAHNRIQRRSLVNPVTS